MPKFRYREKFSSQILASVSLDADTCSNDITTNLLTETKASLDSLEPLIPKSVNLEKNIDLLGIAFNVAVANAFNRNGVGISTESALSIVDYFVHKHMNLEHDRSQVVGHVVSSAFSDYASNEILSKKDVPSNYEPFNIALAGVVYRIVNKKFAQMLEESSDSESKLYQKISTSWELGFNDFAVAVGSDKLSECEVFYGKDKEEYLPFLRMNGGRNALKDGTPVNRLLVGDIYPLGLGFTTDPAADVQGVFAKSLDDELVEENSDEDESSENSGVIINISADFLKNFQKDKNKISLSSKNTVKPINELKTMEYEQLLKDIAALINGKEKQEQKFSEESVASVARYVGESIEKFNKDFEAKVQAEKLAKEEAKAAAEKFEGEVKKTQELLAQTQERLAKFEQEQALAKAEELFNGRMEVVEAEYELADADRKLIASEISKLDEKEESFASYQEKLSVILSHKSKAYIAEAKASEDARIEALVAEKLKALKQETSASAETTAEVNPEAALDKAEQTTASIPNAATEQSDDSIAGKFRKAFQSKPSITVK